MLKAVRSGFVGLGTTLTAWCDANGVSRSNARFALLGKRNGPKAKALRARLLVAAQGEAK
ncbi:MAG: hypothetical protein H7Z12_19875 [Rhodospirillaceae bacterium]|nr:hypothetical protein [Rhodospirillales bacterium]